MAVPATLHIGRPCVQCTPGRVCGPGGGGEATPAGPGWEGGWGGGEGPTRSKGGVGLSGPLLRGCRGGGGGVSRLASPTGGRGGGARTPRGHPPRARTPGSGRVKDDSHPVAPAPRPHDLAGGEPRPCGGVRARARVLVLREQLGVPRGGQHHVPHHIDSGDQGQHRPGHFPVMGSGGMASCQLPRRRQRRVPSRVMPTQCP